MNIALNLFKGWYHHQNLRDNEYNKKNTFVNVRGWNRLNGHSYQFVIDKNPLRHPLAFTVNLGKSGKIFQIHIDLLGFRLFYNFVDAEGKTYGISYYSEAPALVWKWAYGSGFNMSDEGGINKFFYMPWAWEHIQHKIITKNDKWADSLGWQLDKLINKYESYPYTYKLKNGMIQNRTATISVERRVWRWRIFKKLKYFGPKIDQTSINVEFSDQVGERTGSWKGGTTGCSYEMKKGETPLQTLRRMEQEREF